MAAKNVNHAKRALYWEMSNAALRLNSKQSVMTHALGMPLATALHVAVEVYCSIGFTDPISTRHHFGGTYLCGGDDTKKVAVLRALASKIKSADDRYALAFILFVFGDKSGAPTLMGQIPAREELVNTVSVPPEVIQLWCFYFNGMDGYWSAITGVTGGALDEVVVAMKRENQPRTHLIFDSNKTRAIFDKHWPKLTQPEEGEIDAALWASLTREAKLTENTGTKREQGAAEQPSHRSRPKRTRSAAKAAPTTSQY